jgi:ABC-type polysaccharide/polyol phosphate transport system ATPase subunit
VLVVASHSDHLVRDWCNRAALIDAGRLVMIGDVDEVLDTYHRRNQPAELPVAAE